MCKTSISEIVWGIMDHYLQYMLPKQLKTGSAGA